MEEQNISNINDILISKSDQKESDATLIAGMGTNRIEAFSDGVFAIALTLLILDVKVPSAEAITNEAMLQSFLLQQSTAYLSFALSVVVIGIFWVAHHGLFHYIQRANRTLFWLNILFLLFITFIPFPAALLGQFSAYRTSVVIYGASLAVTGIMLDVMRWYATSHHRLVDKNLNLQLIRTARRRNLTGPVLYVLGIILSFLPFNIASIGGIQICLAIFVLVPIVYILPGRMDSYWSGKRLHKAD